MNMTDFDHACELLPEGVTWGEAITPRIVKHIAEAALAAQARHSTDLSEQLREYAGNNGYSHNDYADTMIAAATEIERLAAQAQQPTELSEKCKVAASCLTYNDTEKEAVAKHLLLEASQELRRSQQESQWISVKERLPEDRKDYLVYVKSVDSGKYIKTSHLNPAKTAFCVEYEFDQPTEKITHWMPYPLPPEGE